MMMATILHNPRCSKSREALAILEAAGAEVTVIDYLKAPPSAADLKALYARAGMPPREGMRTAETGAKALTHADDDANLAEMMARQEESRRGKWWGRTCWTTWWREAINTNTQLITTQHNPTSKQ